MVTLKLGPKRLTTSFITARTVPRCLGCVILCSCVKKSVFNGGRHSPSARAWAPRVAPAPSTTTRSLGENGGMSRRCYAQECVRPARRFQRTFAPWLFTEQEWDARSRQCRAGRPWEPNWPSKPRSFEDFLATQHARVCGG